MLNRPRYHLAYPDTMDAQCAAAVVRLWAEAHGGENHVQTYPLPSDEVAAQGQYADLLTRIKARCGEKSGQKSLGFGDHDPAQELVFVLGATLPDGQCELLNTWGRLTTINHREDVVTIMADNRALQFYGQGLSTCEEAWKFLFPHRPMPLCVQLIGRFTVNADEDRGLWWGEIQPFIYAMLSVNTDPGDGWDEWEKLFKELASKHVSKRIKEGLVIMRFLGARRAAEYLAKQNISAAQHIAADAVVATADDAADDEEEGSDTDAALESPCASPDTPALHDDTFSLDTLPPAEQDDDAREHDEGEVEQNG